MHKTNRRRSTWVGLLSLAFGTVTVLHAQSADKPQAGTYGLLYSFQCGTDGSFPAAGLVRDSAGNLYGTTTGGGGNRHNYGWGTVFKIAPDGTEKVLHGFFGSPDAGQPSYGSVTLDAEGNVYGTTIQGGEGGDGAVYKVTPGGRESVLYSFPAGVDGMWPLGGLTRDGAGNVYGTTSQGGTDGNGVVFEFTPGGTESVLYSFGYPPTDGARPDFSLTRDSSGNLYGTTSFGGASYDVGTIFEVTASGTQSPLYSFKGYPTDGAYPSGAMILREPSGDLYGVTDEGGAYNAGALFKLTPTGTESVLLNFNGGSGGNDPMGGLASDAAGNLYGTTVEGGSGTGCEYGCGVLFELTATGTEVLLHDFNLGSSSDGAFPMGGVIRDPSGNLYGTLWSGGANDCGAIFKYTP